jgi:hypothetical protein
MILNVTTLMAQLTVISMGLFHDIFHQLVELVQSIYTITVGCAKAISGGESSERWPILC